MDRAVERYLALLQLGCGRRPCISSERAGRPVQMPAGRLLRQFLVDVGLLRAVVDHVADDDERRAFAEFANARAARVESVAKQRRSVGRVPFSMAAAGVSGTGRLRSVSR